MSEEKKDDNDPSSENGIVLDAKNDVNGDNRANIKATVASSLKGLLERNEGGTIKIEIDQPVANSQDAVERVEHAVLRLCDKIDALMQRMQVPGIVKAKEPIAPKPVLVTKPASPPPVPQEKMDYFIIDMNQVLNYAYKKNDPASTDDMVDTFVKAIEADAPDYVIGYMYASVNFKETAYTTRIKIVKAIESKGIKIGEGGFHVFCTYNYKGKTTNGNVKYQDVDGFIIDKIGEMTRYYGGVVKTFFIVSGDIDMGCGIERVQNNNIAVKVISFDDALSSKIEALVGRENIIMIV